MIFNRFTRTFMSPEEAGQSGGGGEPAPTETPVETPVTETPAEPSKSEETPEPTKTEPTESTLPEKEVDKSKLEQVTGLVEQAGLDMVAIAEYAKANDGSVDLDTMVALKEKHGEAIASLISDQIKGIHKERLDEANQRDNEVYDQVKDAFKDITSDPNQTGESMWTELSGWAKDNVSNEHRADINKLLAQGGLAAKLAVQELTTAFKESLGNTEFQEAALLDGDATATSGGGKDISKHEYTTELNRLLKSGHQYGQSREIAALDARRTKSIQRGIK